ncbi:TPA: cupin domain-containing protein [Candidatus Saccharibacteria bacterium]|nr:cupin domain-containing protein [Candidatus Saccharibacteria bacterium]|tara:strand:+ start:252 stop:668 length:417 start_codon:yes stop_codon:yes gene_type:complete
MQDNGPNPYVVNIEELTLQNENFRTAAWTGSNLQMTLMTIQPGEDIGLEVHEDHDQFLRIEQGTARVEMGPTETSLQTWDAEDDFAIFVPAGVWHNVVNTGEEPLKLYSIYAPPEHAHGTIHETKAIADEAEAAEHGE